MRRLALALVVLFVAAPASAQVAVRGETVYTMAGAPIKDGVVLVGKDGKIERVGPASGVNVPSGYRTLRAEKRAGGQRLLHEIELWEVSLVTFPMLPEARVRSDPSDLEAGLEADLARMEGEARLVVEDREGVRIEPAAVAPGASASMAETLRRLRGGMVICQFGGLVVPDEGDLSPLAAALECPLFLVRADAPPAPPPLRALPAPMSD